MIANTSVSGITNFFYSTNMAYLASGVVGFMVLIYSVYNGFFYVFKPAKYKGIRFTTKNIAYITMLSAVSVTVTIVVSVTFPITVFPPIRIAFEGLMVKITGYIFGPIVGLLSGVITDGLAMLFVPSYIHVAYIIVIASFGFLSGCIGVFNKAIGKRKYLMLLFINFFLIALGILAGLISYYSRNDVELFPGTSVSPVLLTVFIGLGIGGTLLLLWIAYFGFQISPSTRSRWDSLLPIIALAVVTEYWVTTFISAWGDIAFLTASQGSSKGYGGTMIARLVMAPFKIVFNSMVIYITYQAVSKLITKDE